MGLDSVGSQPRGGNPQPQLTVSIVSHGQGELLAPLLQQLMRAACQLPIQVIVTQNLPEERCVVDEDPAFNLVWIQNDCPKGFGENHNAAFRVCLAPYFCVLNPDVRLTANCLEALVKAIAHQPGVVGPRVTTPSGRLEDSARKVPTLARLLLRWSRRRFEPDYLVSVSKQQVDWLAGMCLVFDRDTFTALNGFDERYHLYCEDVDICLRVHLIGRAVTWVQCSEVVHDAQRASRRKWRYLTWHMQSLARLVTSVAYWQFRLRAPRRY